MKQNRKEEWLTIPEAGAILGVPDSHIQRMIAGKAIRTTRHATEYLLNSDDLEQLCRNPQSGGVSLIHWSLPWLTAATVIAIMVGSLLPGVSLQPYDKEVHWFAYLVLSCLVMCSLPQLKRALWGNGLVLALGAFLEYAQVVISGRHFEYEDLAANYLGVISGMILGALLMWRRSRGSQGRCYPNEYPR